MTCGVCGVRFRLGALILVRDLYGKRRRVVVCGMCSDRSRRVGYPARKVRGALKHSNGAATE